jgi:hypothetical protein
MIASLFLEGGEPTYNIRAGVVQESMALTTASNNTGLTARRRSLVKWRAWWERTDLAQSMRRSPAASPNGYSSLSQDAKRVPAYSRSF